MRLRALFLLLGFLTLAELGIIVYLARNNVSPAFPETAVRSPASLQPDFSQSPIPASPPFDWSRVESADYKTYIANLRAIGCPEETVRDIIIADVDKLLASRARIVTPRRATQYWEPEEREVTTVLSDDQGRQLQALEKEKRALLKELLGFDFYAERRKLNGDEDMSDRRLGFLPEAKREQVRAWLEKYAAIEHSLQEKTALRHNAPAAQDRAELKAMRAASEAELSTILTPRESELYQLWTSPAAVAARFALGGMDSPREQDFLVIYNIRKSLDREFDPESLDLNDPAALKAWSKASTDAEAQIRTQLGEERYAQYLRGQDHNYRQLLEIARQYNLPPGAAAKIYDLKIHVEAAATKVISDQTVSEPSRTADLEPIRHDAEQSVRELMGETAYQHYRRNGNAGWLQSN